MTANELVIAARLATHYEDQRVLKDGQDALEVAAHDLLEFKRKAPKLWRRLHDSTLSDRKIGDWLYEFFVRHAKSGATLKNFAADELERSGV